MTLCLNLQMVTEAEDDANKEETEEGSTTVTLPTDEGSTTVTPPTDSGISKDESQPSKS